LYHRTPVTPASPYTPLSLRSFTSSSSGDTSTLTTPDRVGLNTKRLSFSPEVARTTAGGLKDQSLADIAENWRSRASENGIKVSSANEDSQYGDDEGGSFGAFIVKATADNAHIASETTLSDAANDSGVISTEDGSFHFLSRNRQAI
jgi:hypothetical protein